MSEALKEVHEARIRHARLVLLAADPDEEIGTVDTKDAMPEARHKRLFRAKIMEPRIVALRKHYEKIGFAL